MKILIIPDIHNKHVRAQRIIDSEGSDKIIFLGDYFDDFHDSVQDVKETAKWLKNSLTDKNRIHLFGNHDIGYAFPCNSYCICSGWEKEKSRAINNIFSDDDWRQFKWFHNEDDVLFFHGGMDERRVRANETILSNILEYLEEQSEIAFRRASTLNPHSFYEAGRSRGGIWPVGGLLWCDFIREFKHHSLFHSIVGHTPVKVPVIKNGGLTLEAEDKIHLNRGGMPYVHIDLDTHLNHYAIFDTETRQLEIKRYSEL